MLALRLARRLTARRLHAFFGCAPGRSGLVYNRDSRTLHVFKVHVHWGDVPGHAASKADDSKGKDEAGPPGETGPAMPAPA